MTNGSSSGTSNEQLLAPSMMSSGWAPACSAAASTNSLMLEPVWRGASAMFVSRSLGTKPRPPTMARMAAVLVSSVTIAASKPCAVSGSTLRACSASACRCGSNVVWMRSPPRNSAE